MHMNLAEFMQIARAGLKCMARTGTRPQDPFMYPHTLLFWVPNVRRNNRDKCFKKIFKPKVVPKNP